MMQLVVKELPIQFRKVFELVCYITKYFLNLIHQLGD